MRAIALVAVFSAAVSASALAQGAAPPASARTSPPRSVGSGVTMVPGAAGTVVQTETPPAPRTAPAAQASAGSAPTAQKPPATEALERRDEFIRRSVMQSICKGC